VSCDWDVWCVDCDEAVTRFCDANHREELMAALVRHAPAIAALAPLVNDADAYSIDLTTSWGRIDPASFAAHAGHKLKPRDEYGRWLDQCHGYVKCADERCGHQRQCSLKLGHEGACA
jgi:hypothetical protein